MCVFVVFFDVFIIHFILLIFSQLFSTSSYVLRVCVCVYRLEFLLAQKTSNNESLFVFCGKRNILRLRMMISCFPFFFSFFLFVCVLQIKKKTSNYISHLFAFSFFLCLSACQKYETAFQLVSYLKQIAHLRFLYVYCTCGYISLFYYYHQQLFFLIKKRKTLSRSDLI